MQDYQQTIQAQFGNSQILTELLADWNENIDPAGDINNIYDVIFNVKTASGYGLDVLGRIVGVTRYVPIVDLSQYFGFNDADNSFSPFNTYPFYNSVTIFNGQYLLPDTAFRILILAKALSNLSSCSASALNQLLKKLFIGRGVCYVDDLGGMAMQYVFDFPLEAYEISILSLTGILPKPTGVATTLLVMGVTIVI